MKYSMLKRSQQAVSAANIKKTQLKLLKPFLGEKLSKRIHAKISVFLN
jgi:hypothetical protein